MTSQNMKKIVSSPFFSAGLVIFAFILTATGSFALGRLSAIEDGKRPVEIKYDFWEMGKGSNFEILSQMDKKLGAVIASVNGSVYHLPWCSGARTIKSENIVVFDSRDDAEKAGYSPAKNCRGL